MIITIFTVLLGLTLIFFFVGKYTDAPVLQVVGSGFLFILGLVVMTGSLAYSGGEISEKIFTYNGTNITATQETVTPQYLVWNDEIVSGIKLNHVFGLFIAVAAVLAFINLFFNLGYWGRNE